jgi:hypothetical protein
MRFKLHHPLWMHLPALACIAINVGLLLSAHLPARVPIDFNNGLPDSWGSPLDLWLSMICWPLLLVIGSAVLDESWARIEQQQRRFNWISLLDECVIGFLLGKNMMMVPQLSKPEPALSESWPLTLLIAGVAVALAVLLELRRPYRPARETEVDVAGLAQSIQHQFQPGGRWFYWETMDSLSSRFLAVIIAVPSLVFAGECAKKSHYGGVVFFAFLAVFLVSCYGGVHIALTPGQFTVRGRFGLPLLRLKLANVAKVEVVTFSGPLDFGGWGFYRYTFRLHAWGLYVWGGGGVIVQTKKGRRFLIGSKSPEKLAAATEAARIAAMFSPDDVKGFDAAVEGIIPSQNAIRMDPDSIRAQSSRIGRLCRGLYQVVIAVVVILIIAAMLFEPGSIKYTITSEGLTIHDLFYEATIKSADIDIEHIKVVDIEVDPHWHPTEKIKGSSSKHYKAGWFRVAGGDKIRLYRTTSQRLVLLPPKGQNAPVLLEVKQPEAFIQEVRQAWQ